MIHQNSRFPIFVIFFIDTFGIAIVFPMIAPFILDPKFGFFSAEMSMAIKNIYVGVMLAAYPFAQFFGSPFFGDIADQIGRKKALYLTVIGTLIGFSISGVAISFRSFSLLLFTRLVTGFCAGNASICLAALADLAKEEKERAKSFAVISFLGGISWIIAIILGGVLSQDRFSGSFGSSLPLYITALLSLLSIFVLAYLFKETHRPKGKGKINMFAGIIHIWSAFKMPKLRFLYGVYLIWIFSWIMGMEWFTPISLQVFKIDQNAITIGLAIMGVAWSLGGCVFNRLFLKKFSVYRLTRMSAFVVALFMSLVALSFSYPYVVGVFSVASAFAAMVWSNMLGLMSMRATEDDQGAVMGVGMSMQALGWVLGPLIGTLFANLHIASIYWIAAVISWLAFISLWGIRRQFL